MTRPSVIMTGPLPPIVGGMSSVIAVLAASSLAHRTDLHLFETGKTTPQGRSLSQGVAERLRLMATWWKALGRSPRPLVHIHTCSGLTFFLDGLLLLLARLRGCGVVLHVHGARFDAFLDGLPSPIAALSHWIARRAGFVVVLSDEWLTRLAKRWPRARLKVVSNGVQAAARACGVDSPKPPRFVFVGNLGRRKGVHVLLDAAALAKHPWTVGLAGGVEEPGFDRWVREEISRRGLADRLSLLGAVVGDEKSSMLADAQGFVLPSLAEGLPMALLEAMAAGLPAVVTAVGAMAEAVRDGVDGFVVPAGDAFSLASALDRLAADPPLRRALGESAARRCESLYGIERMVDALMRLYGALPGIAGPEPGSSGGSPLRR